MPLTAEQREKIRSLIGPSYNFEDLALIVEKSDGDIHSIASSSEPRNAIALKCLDWADRTGKPRIFLRHVLLAPQCPAELRAIATGIFPELEAIGRPFAAIVAETSERIVIASARLAAGQGSGKLQQAMEDLGERIAELRCYKALHEALHQLQLNGSPHLGRDNSENATKAFLREVAGYEPKLRTAHINAKEALAALPTDSKLHESEEPWVAALAEFAMRIRRGRESKDIGEVTIALDVCGRRIERAFDETNNQINKCTHSLPLDRLLAAMVDNMPMKGTAPAVTDVVSAINGLGLALTAAVEVHNRWQEAEDTFRLLDSSFEEETISAFRKFQRAWGVCCKQLRTLADASGRQAWSVEVPQHITAIENALFEVERALSQPTQAISRDVFGSLVSEPYDALRREARMAFFEVDGSLKRKCAELLRVHAPLEQPGGRT